MSLTGFSNTAPRCKRSIRTFSGAHRLWLAPSPGFRPLPPSTTERRASCRKRRRAERGKTPRTSPSWQMEWYMSFRFFSFKHGKLRSQTMYKRKKFDRKKKKKKNWKMPRRRSTSESGHRHHHHHHTHSVSFIFFCPPFLFIIAHSIKRNGSFFFSYFFIFIPTCSFGLKLNKFYAFIETFHSHSSSHYPLRSLPKLLGFHFPPPLLHTWFNSNAQDQGNCFGTKDTKNSVSFPHFLGFLVL